ncbi:MAG: zinc ribbon domain-containing protein [Kiritimatiellae bacterium]|nr:zinc ribbon domain-containing protein [Kiritimatiellia bacterium]
MPTYEYECQKCGHRFEKFQKISDPPVKRCPQCRCKVKKLISTGAGIIFKGSGFYETDYRSDNYKKSAKAEKEKSQPPKDDKSSSSKKKDKGSSTSKSKG